MKSKRYKILERTLDFSGKTHRLVERVDGFRFYLDEAFLFALEQAGSEELSQELIKRGARSEEISEIMKLLHYAGLSDESVRKNDDE